MEIQAKYSNALPNERAAAAKEAAAKPEAALRRLNLTGKARGPWQDIVSFDASDVRSAARTIEAEGERLQTDHARGSQATTALTLIVEKLADMSKLVKENVKSGASKTARQQNQAKINKALEEIDKAIRDAGESGAKVLDGTMKLTAGDESLAIPQISLSTLGRVSAAGRKLSLEDLASRGRLDTRRRKSSVGALAQRSINEATETVTGLQKQIEAFQSDKIRPRMGDVAITLEGLFTGAEHIGSGETAKQVAREIRDMIIDQGTAAVAAGADGWDRERLIELLTGESE